MAPPIEKDGVARNGKISGPINLWRNIVDQLFLDPVPTVGKKGIIMTLTVCLASCGIFRNISPDARRRNSKLNPWLNRFDRSEERRVGKGCRYRWLSECR